MKFKNYTDKEKATLQLYEEQGKLYRAKYNRPSIPLDKPYQKGWKRFFKVRADILRSPLGNLATAILDAIQHTDYSPREDFMRKGHKSKKYELMKANVRRLSEWEWEKNKYPESWLKHFLIIINRYGRHEYVFQKAWWFEEVIQPHMITHYYEADAEIDDRIEEIQQIIMHNELDVVYMGMRKGRNVDEWDMNREKKRRLDNLSKKEIRDALS